MEIKKVNFMHLSIIFMAIYIFFWDFKYVNSRYVLLLSVVLALYNIMINKSKLLFNKINSFFLVIILYNMISLFYTSNFYDGVRFILVLVVTNILIFAMTEDDRCVSFAVKVLVFFSFLQVIALFMQYAFPEKITQISRLLLKYEAFYNNKVLLSYGYYCGINQDNLMSGLYCALLGSFLFVSFLTDDNKIKKIFYMIGTAICIAAIFATQKRGILISFAVAMAATLFVMLRNKRKALLRLIFTIFIFGAIFIYIMKFTPYGQQMMMRFTMEENLFSGRDIIYRKLYSHFSENYILGHGVGSVYSVAEAGAHNIYLHILYENGIVGLILYSLLFSYAFYLTVGMICTRDFDVKTKRLLYYSVYTQALFLVYGMSGNPLYDNYVLFVYAISISIPLAVKRRETSYVEEKNFCDELVGTRRENHT
ncbi:MAG: O-antigen ligase family protein [Clostridia bacterium]|nr:O-antigen ligase family protein [Clostridia bacterium]